MKQGNGSEISSEGISGANQCPVVFILQATYCPLPWGGGMATDAPTWSRCLVSSLPRHVSVMSPEALAQAGARGGLVALERTVDRGKRPGGASAPRGPGSGTGHSHPGAGLAFPCLAPSGSRAGARRSWFDAGSGPLPSRVRLLHEGREALASGCTCCMSSAGNTPHQCLRCHDIRNSQKP